MITDSDNNSIATNLQVILDLIAETDERIKLRIIRNNELHDFIFSTAKRVHKILPPDSTPARLFERKMDSFIETDDMKDLISYCRPIYPTMGGGVFSKNVKAYSVLSKQFVDPSYSETLDAFRGIINETIRDIEERSTTKQSGNFTIRKPEEEKMSVEKRVFVIYGHDDVTLTKVEALLRRIGVQPIIFSQLSNRGAKTNIEILEENLPSADAVVAILTPDDEGRKKGTTDLEPRARQNVLIEAGYALISKRHSSLIVAVGGVTIPSDFDGINRIQSTTFDRAAEVDLACQLAEVLQIMVPINKL